MKFSRTLALMLLIFSVYWSFKSLMPSYKPDKGISLQSFSTDRALTHVEQLSKKPHAVGFPGHERAKSYIISELKKMGLETITQEGHTAGDWGNLSRATNILARIQGSGNGKALLLLSHYDSSPHSSHGASDAGSGVATILEGIRAFLNENKAPKNDIIILITDAEELGLNGADLFVNKHPWAKDVGLALNFEARGSGGPSYMLIETNRGNSTLIKAFKKANPKYPVANSLAYSIYKMLPNDTDLTVFREDGDIEGFNFAFIDDHFDYHTALDNYERLDRNTLAHQGSYLMPLLTYFSDADLNNLKSLDDEVYYNLPFYNMVSYPFEWIWPMFGVAVLAFLLLLISGVKKKKLNTKDIFKGFVPVLITLIVNGLVGYFCWSVITWWYPSFKDMLHGFTYNGHTYIAVYVMFSLFVCFYTYHKFRKTSTPNLLVAPLCIWLLICGLVAHYLKGASFFIVPLFGLLAGLLVTINQEKPNPFLMVFLALPAVLIYSPFIKMFPVGLGLKMMVAATLLTTLLFFLGLPFFGQLKSKGRLAYLFLFLFFAFGISSHIQSDFNEERPKPSSLLYVYNADTDSTQWATYDNVLIDWNGQFLGDGKRKPNTETISSKYRTNLNYVADAPKKNIQTPYIDTVMDTVIGKNRIIELCVTPKRDINRLEVFTNPIDIRSAKVNRIALSSYFLEHRKSRLVTHYITNNDFTELQLEFPKDSVLELTLYEASNNLLTHPDFSIPERPKNSIPMPFVLNDAILTIKTLRFD
ncbi:M28 family peptidase [Flagellimonas halotolerans]|uniref:Vacuolar membrane protease n=2 Tax=Flagellimonas halotolerans TaxID=3112164 RepID=A0ABU6ILZ8_9FLAO|nr:MULTISPECIES: M28 family peptidase [unclassified Allomuricauda]MEC3964211.1 M28 family peptidase [Muricauda sp. SYSU M86414]MEC4264081.1 M28 family peptidase [Muricauda sp. SYSU M84420]